MPTTLTSVSEPSFSGPLARFADSLGAAFGTLPAGAQIAFVIAFGLVIGSFLNVVVHRLPIMLERAWRAEVSEATDHAFDEDGLPGRYNLWLPRSACPHCGHARPVLALQDARELSLSAARTVERGLGLGRAHLVWRNGHGARCVRPMRDIAGNERN